MKSRQIERKWIVILFVIIAYLIFLCLKINGYLDYSGKYGTEFIMCNQKYSNTTFVLDGDTYTTWGLDEEHSRGEEYTIKFRNKRIIKQVDILNNRYMDYVTKENWIYHSDDGVEWEPCFGSIKDDGKGLRSCVFDQAYECSYLKLVYMDEEPGCWPITEIFIY